uniref:Uncharacterized protein n=1 Tax=Anabas testudineus TaxID=64144 RepID=A0A7N5ZVU2_ANATE
ILPGNTTAESCCQHLNTKYALRHLQKGLYSTLGSCPCCPASSHIVMFTLTVSYINSSLSSNCSTAFNSPSETLTSSERVFIVEMIRFPY